MKIFLDNVKIKTNRGFSVFARSLMRSMIKQGHSFVSKLKDSDIHLVFVFNSSFDEKIPMVQRLDGIYFNPNINYMGINLSICSTYKKAMGIIVQSKFDKDVILNFLGHHPNLEIIYNGTDMNVLSKIDPVEDKRLDGFEKIWASSSRWVRKNKRLEENIRYFMEHSGNKDCMVIDGDGGKDKIPKHDRIFYFGELPWEKHIGMLKKSDNFIHLAIVDHCPNAVIEARACGCKIICSSLGGTKEIAGKDAVVIKDMDWDMKTPFNYTDPPKMDFSKKMCIGENNSIDINDISEKYLNFFTKLGD